MRVSSALHVLLSALLVALYSSPCTVVHAAANTAGAPEHLIAQGGECVRLFHSRGSIGCRSITKADMAALFPIESESDLTKWLGDASDLSTKHVLVLPEHLMSSSLLSQAKERLAGIMAFPHSDHNVTFASQTPQGDGSVDAKLNPFASAKVQWNKNGLGLVDASLAFPVVLLKNNALGQTFLERAKMNVKSSSGATYRAFMKYYYGPKDMSSLQCLQFKNVYGNRSPRCDPIGGQSAWGVRGDRTSNETIVVMAGMDAYGLSQVLVPGANEAASGIVALLAAVKALQVIPDSEFTKQIVFAAFQAEKFGFVGSRRFLQDVNKAAKDATGYCKTRVTGSKSPFGSEFCSSPVYPSVAFAGLKPSTFTHAIAVDQVGLLDKSRNFSIHVNPNAPKAPAAALVETIAQTPSAKSQFAQSSVSGGALPPTPLLSFVNGGEFGQKQLVGAVIGGYDAQFQGTGVFGSRHDVVDNLDVDAVVQASQVLAETVYLLGVGAANGTATSAATASSLATIQVDKDLVTKMLTCISTNWGCELMKNYSTPWVQTMVKYLNLVESSWPAYKRPASLYSGPMDSDRQPLVINGADKDTYSYLTDYTGAWSDDANRVNLFPNAYEVFTRAFLATHLADSTATVKDKSCTKTQDCGDASGLECVYPGVCASQRAHFHDAYSPGLSRTKAMQVYDIVDETMPLWTEPQWDNDVGSYVFPDPGEAIGWIALAMGGAITGGGALLSKWLLRGVHKMKLL